MLRFGVAPLHSDNGVRMLARTHMSVHALSGRPGVYSGLLRLILRQLLRYSLFWKLISVSFVTITA